MYEDYTTENGLNGIQRKIRKTMLTIMNPEKQPEAFSRGCDEIYALIANERLWFDVSGWHRRVMKAMQEDHGIRGL